jgi:hypothetical protein
VDVEPTRKRSIACEDEAAPDESGHGRPRQPPQPNGKKPCDADRHAGWSHLADKAPRPLVFGGDRSEVEFAGDPSNEPRRATGEKPTVRVGRARGSRRQCETRKRPSVRAHRTRGCATRQSCTREHHATVEAAPLRAASPSRLRRVSVVAAATAPAAVDLCRGRRRLRLRRAAAGLLCLGKRPNRKKGRPYPVRGSCRRVLRLYGVRRKLGRCHLRRLPQAFSGDIRALVP